MNIQIMHGNERVSQHFKKAYTKAFFTLIKAYKRYYLGAQLLKIPFYKLISKQTKLAKWQEKRTQRREFLREALNGFKSAKHLYKTFHKESEKWLNSQEFKQKYLDTKHPFPPLLNPDKINYKNIDAKIAWELNLPIPSYYDFILYSNGSSATALSILFLEKCDILHHIGYHPKEIYIAYYNLMSNPPYTKKICLFFWAATVNVKLPHLKDDAEHFLCVITKKVPLLKVERDPIGRLKHFINHLGGSSYDITPTMKRFNLTCGNYKKFF